MDLQASAARLAELVPRDSLQVQAVAYADRSTLRHERWTVAFSGGLDSVVTLLLVWAHWPTQRKNLIAAHFNHALRGPESDRDEAFCRKVAAELGVECRVGRWIDPPNKVNEELARKNRWKFLEETVQAEGSSLVFTGHHLDDVFETQLMRLARGSGSAGLSAPRPVRKWSDNREIVRILLGLKKSEIADAAAAAQIGWGEDSSNRQDDFLRNRIRRTVVPAWIQAAGPSALKGAALARERLQEEDEALDEWVKEIDPLDGSGRLDLMKLTGKPTAVWRRALRLWLGGVEISRSGFHQLMELAQSGTGKMSLGSRWALAEDKRLFWLDKPVVLSAWKSCHLILDTDLILPDGGILRGKIEPMDADLRRRVDSGQIDDRVESITSLLESPLIRSWVAGDYYRPLGGAGSTKLQDLFVNRKVSRTERQNLPLICRPDGRIVWVPGLPPADDSKIHEATVMALQLTYTPGTSTLSS